MKNRFFLAVALCGCIGLSSCAALSPAKTNRDITMGIASAGAAANSAENLYQTKQIPQTDANRKAINDLGSAYNEAKAAWLVVLTAESVYRGSQNVQLAVCAPGAAATDLKINGAAVSCPQATTNAAKAKAQLDADNAALAAKVSALSASTAAVQSLAKGK
jgi:hypothetical protein